MDDNYGACFTVAFVLGAILVGSIVNVGKKDYEDFTKEHNKIPYCIEREIGHEIIKKCYIAKEVDLVCRDLPGFPNVCNEIKEVK